MRVCGIWLCAWLTICLCLSACSSRSPAVLKSDASPDQVKVIALLPVANNSTNSTALKMLRNKLNEELRFKGYTQIESDVIDSKLMSLTGEKELKNNGTVPPKAIEELLGADAAMYCSLLEGKTSTGLFYAPVTVSVQCDLRSTKTGETLWSAQSKSTSRSFDLMRTSLQMKSVGDLEKAMEEVVGKVLETLPYGPRLRG
jgi:hypothetical protein